MIPSLRVALADRAVAVVAASAAVGLAYVVALAIATPENEGDALAYHVARAAFWYQQHGVGYIGNAIETRLNVNPPNAELGALFTMLVSGTQRFVGLVQVTSLVTCATAAAGIARRIGLSATQALFGALLLVTLPVIVTQAWTAQNDLVVGAMLATAAFFLLGKDRHDFALAGLAIALAIGTKFTAVLSLPLLLVIGVVAPGPRVVRVALSFAIGAVGGAVWYIVNLVETGRPDGGLAETANQSSSHSLGAVLNTLQRFVFDALDLSGLSSSDWRWDRHLGTAAFLYRGIGMTILAVGLLAALRSERLRSSSTALGAGILVATGPSLVALAYRMLYLVHQPPGHPVDYGSNIFAGATPSWYGPLGVIAVIAGVVVVAVEARKRTVPGIAMALALAPVILIGLLSVSIVWDPWRGRFLIGAFVLAAGSWGVMLSRRWLAWGLTVLGVITMALVLANAQSKPSGLRTLDRRAEGSIWGKPEWWVESILRSGDDRRILRAVMDVVPDHATVAVAPRGNDFLSPYFGRDLTRHVELVLDGDRVDRAAWLVAAPGVRPVACQHEWGVIYRTRPGWLIARRRSSDACGRAARRRLG